MSLFQIEGSFRFLQPSHQDCLKDPFIRTFWIIIESFQLADFFMQLREPQRQRVKVRIPVIQFLGYPLCIRPFHDIPPVSTPFTDQVPCITWNLNRQVFLSNLCLAGQTGFRFKSPCPVQHICLTVLHFRE